MALSESLLNGKLLILNLLNLLVIHKALWNGSFMKSEWQGVTSISKAVLKAKMYTSRDLFDYVKSHNFCCSNSRQKIARFLAILGKKLVTKALQKLSKWWQIATSGHNVWNHWPMSKNAKYFEENLFFSWHCNFMLIAIVLWNFTWMPISKIGISPYYF